jgi:hypothetical protein
MLHRFLTILWKMTKPEESGGVDDCERGALGFLCRRAKYEFDTLSSWTVSTGEAGTGRDGSPDS